MPDNVIGDVFEGLSQTVGKTVQQAVKTPFDILETGAKQVAGQAQNGQMPDEKWQAQRQQKMISQMRQNDDQNKKPQLAEIRQNLAAMMQTPKTSEQELPKYVSGKPGFSMDKIKNQEEDKKKNKLPDLLEMLKLKNRGSGERHRGVSG
ncbi:hypothetical protein HY030_02800 [Candidatus Gottesmanbacteria bacterium]|nr:hypothetical protein [Candidatus Gottesmanbacteria bacterium]